jgi:hypothetical protein
MFSLLCECEYYFANPIERQYHVITVINMASDPPKFIELAGVSHRSKLVSLTQALGARATRCWPNIQFKGIRTNGGHLPYRGT